MLFSNELWLGYYASILKKKKITYAKYQPKYLLTYF